MSSSAADTGQAPQDTARNIGYSRKKLLTLRVPHIGRFERRHCKSCVMRDQYWLVTTEISRAPFLKYAVHDDDPFRGCGQMPVATTAVKYCTSYFCVTRNLRNDLRKLIKHMNTDPTKTLSHDGLLFKW